MTYMNTHYPHLYPSVACDHVMILRLHKPEWSGLERSLVEGLTLPGDV